MKLFFQVLLKGLYCFFAVIILELIGIVNKEQSIANVALFLAIDNCIFITQFQIECRKILRND